MNAQNITTLALSNCTNAEIKHFNFTNLTSLQSLSLRFFDLGKVRIYENNLKVLEIQYPVCKNIDYFSLHLDRLLKSATLLKKTVY